MPNLSSPKCSGALPSLKMGLKTSLRRILCHFPVPWRLCSFVHYLVVFQKRWISKNVGNILALAVFARVSLSVLMQSPEVSARGDDEASNFSVFLMKKGIWATYPLRPGHLGRGLFPLSTLPLGNSPAYLACRLLFLSTFKKLPPGFLRLHLRAKWAFAILGENHERFNFRLPTSRK